MAPRANWKGFLRLSLVTCPVALYPATSESEKISFNQLNRKTGHRIKYAKVDADTGEEVANEDIVKGYALDKDTFVEVTKEELEDLALESTRTIEIDEFVDRDEIDPRYLIRLYYLRPDGKVGHDAFAVIRETIKSMNKVAIGRVVLTNREHPLPGSHPPGGVVGRRRLTANADYCWICGSDAGLARPAWSRQSRWKLSEGTPIPWARAQCLFIALLRSGGGRHRARPIRAECPTSVSSRDNRKLL